MTDEQFAAELEIRAYLDQIGGFPIGDPVRQNYRAEWTVIRDAADGPVNREKTLAQPCYHRFTAEDRAKLLERD